MSAYETVNDVENILLFRHRQNLTVYAYILILTFPVLVFLGPMQKELTEQELW